MRRFGIVGLCTLFGFHVMGQNRFCIRDFGAVADGKTDNTAAIQKAIDACAGKGGGTVLVEGGAFMTYTLYLKSHVRLEVAGGASLEGGPDPALYPEFDENTYWKVPVVGRSRRAMFYAVKQTNIAVTGQGVINGRAEHFHHRDEKGHMVRNDDHLIPGRCLFFVGCEDVLLDGITILNPAGWSTWFLDCDRLQVRGVKIKTGGYPNGDGLHISSCRDVTVSDCIIHSADDALILRSLQEQFHKPKGCERVTVSNCILSSGGANAIRIGWTHDFQVKDCVLNNLVIQESAHGIRLQIPGMRKVNQKDPPRGPRYPPPPERVEPFSAENIRFSNIVLSCKKTPVLIGAAREAGVSRIRNIVFSNLSAVSEEMPTIQVLPKDHVSDILFENCRFTVLKTKAEDEVKTLFRNNHVKNLMLDRVVFTEEVR